MNMVLHHFLLYFDHTGEERLLALGGSGQSPQETIYTAPLIHSSLVNSATKLTLLPYLNTKPSKVRVISKLIYLFEMIETFCRCCISYHKLLLSPN